MSTIEKAASRLAARERTAAKDVSSELETARRANGRVSVPSRESRPAKVDIGSGPGASRGLQYCEIDLHDLHERGFLLPDSGRTQLAQEMRRIKRPLLLNIQKQQALAQAEAPGEETPPPANLIMITSALPGEGKTFTAINLAMSIAAEVDRRVLLVDADVARGDVSCQLHLNPARGLSDLIQETNHLFEDAVLTTNVERLSILPAGSPNEQVDELFASEMMETVTRDLAEADPQRVVIFDASPLLATTEAAVLARHMGQTVVVVEAGKTPQDAVMDALAQIEGCANVSLVLNKTFGKDANGYTYGYPYGSYGAGERESRQAQQTQQAEQSRAAE